MWVKILQVLCDFRGFFVNEIPNFQHKSKKKSREKEWGEEEKKWEFRGVVRLKAFWYRRWLLLKRISESSARAPHMATPKRALIFAIDFLINFASTFFFFFRVNNSKLFFYIFDFYFRFDGTTGSKKIVYVRKSASMWGKSSRARAPVRERRVSSLFTNCSIARSVNRY